MFRSINEIAVTGVGIVCPLGENAQSSYSALASGKSAASLINEPWADDLPCRLASRVQTDFQAQLGSFLCNRLDRCGQLALMAGRQAWDHSGLSLEQVGADRVAVILGTGIGGQGSLLQNYQRFLSKAKRLNPLAVVMTMPNAASAQLAIDLGCNGGAHTPVSACASGAEAIAWGRLLLVTNEADVVVVGGAESVINPLSIKGFTEMRALSCRHDDPAGACRPFGVDRSGFVLGEGAGVLIMERRVDAEARGACIYGLLLGAGMTSDAHHLAMPDPRATQASTAMRKALISASVKHTEISWISAHATGTTLGDLAEATAIEQVFESDSDQVLVTALKGSVGHLLAAAGPVESILTLQCLQQAQVPASLNSHPVDPAVKLRIPNKPERLSLTGRTIALKNTFGFGGHNVCLVWASL